MSDNNAEKLDKENFVAVITFQKKSYYVFETNIFLKLHALFTALVVNRGMLKLLQHPVAIKTTMARDLPRLLQMY